MLSEPLFFHDASEPTFVRFETKKIGRSLVCVCVKLEDNIIYNRFYVLSN